MYDSSRKHIIGYALLIILIAFYYLFSFIVFDILDFLALLTEGVFLVVYVGLLIFLSWYYKKNDLFSECVMLNIFCFTLANPYFLPVVYYPIFATLKDSAYFVNIDKFFNALAYPLNVFYTNIPLIVFIISPIIPLISFIKIRKQRKRKNNIEINDDNFLNNPDDELRVEENK